MGYYRVIPIPERGQKLLRDGFHGTSHDLVGKSIRPSVGTQHKVFNFSADNHVNYTAASPTYDYVQSANYGDDRVSNAERAAAQGRTAERMAEERGWSWAGSSAGRFPGRPRVHVGRAVGEIGGDGNLSSEQIGHDLLEGRAAHGAMAAKRFQVKDTIWTPPSREPGDPQGVQGTIPHINWNQFGAANVAPNALYDAITPTDASIHWSEEQRQTDAATRQRVGARQQRRQQSEPVIGQQRMFKDDF